ncbi:hypothetical protein HZH66_010139 [Vespula vulgaris]|uniref:Uncharacterized protein n=1 Tax=Vespula vulgaris TaxID=7454 RepID=A0A834JJE0_VESVU|nr:hypothetical protein HZH66_010139 [Vespula vulgaris]
MDLRTVLDIDGYRNPCGGKCSPRAVKLPKMLIVGTKRCSSFLLTHCSCGEPDYSTRPCRTYGIILFILNGALWAFGGIDRPRSGNRAGSEIRSRDFPWVPSPTNDPAAATTAAFVSSMRVHKIVVSCFLKITYFSDIDCLRHEQPQTSDVEAAGATTIGKSRMGMKGKGGGIEKQEALAQEQISISRSHPIAITFAWILLDAVT